MKDKPSGSNERGGYDRSSGNDRRDDGRGPREGGYKKPYGERSGGSSYGGDRKPFDGERKPYGERSGGSGYGGDRKPFDGERKPYGERSGGSSYGGDRKPYGDRKPFDGERKPYGERSGGSSYGGERKPYGDRKPFDGERKPYGERSYPKRSEGFSKPGGYIKRGEAPNDQRETFNRRQNDRGADNVQPNEDRDWNSRLENQETDGQRIPYDAGSKPFERPRKPYGGGERKPYDERKSERDSRVAAAPVDGEAQGDSDEKKKDSESAERPNRREFGAERPNRSEKPDRRVGDIKYAPNYDFERMEATLPPKKRAKIERSNTDEIRLNRFIANAGVCSRREADGLIEAGQITVNGKVVSEMGYRVAMSDVVKYGNRVLNGQKMVYILLNKPKDYITTTDDPQDRHTIMELIAGACDERVYPVGRLDRNTTGLLLLTNDGELAEKLTHPSYETHKIYQVELDKPMTNDHFEAMRAGVELEDGVAKPDSLALVTPDAEVIGIEIHSGRNRIVRRMFEHFGYEVSKLDRTVFAGLDKKTLPRGKWRFLTEREVIKLKFLS